MDMRFGTWNVRCLYRAGSLMTVSRELARYIDLGEVGWGDVDWIGLAQDKNRRRALVNSVLNLRVP
jgi:hypothetical protein